MRECNKKNIGKKIKKMRECNKKEYRKNIGREGYK